MNIGNIVLTQCDTVGYHGARCIEIILGGKNVVQLNQIVQLIDAALYENNIIGALVTLDGFSPADYDPNEALELCQILRSKNYTVIGKTYGMTFPRWFVQPNGPTYTVTYVDNQLWMRYKVDEIIYQPRDTDVMAEPIVGQNNAASAKAILLQNESRMTELPQFYAKATMQWNILTPQAFSYVNVLF